MIKKIRRHTVSELRTYYWFLNEDGIYEEGIAFDFMSSWAEAYAKGETHKYVGMNLVSNDEYETITFIPPSEIIRTEIREVSFDVEE